MDVVVGKNFSVAAERLVSDVTIASRNFLAGEKLNFPQSKETVAAWAFLRAGIKGFA